MDRKSTGKWGMALGLVGLSWWAAVGCSSEPPVDGTGGTGTGGVGTGGAGTGGASGGTGGGSSYPCNEELTGTGGAIFLFNCDHWLGEHGEEYALDFSCGQGGQGGAGGEGGASVAPALERVCEAESSPDFNIAHPVFHCLDQLTDDVCSSEHEAEVTACLTQEAQCGEDLEELGCTDKLDECATLDVGTCYWAMVSARNPAAIDTCFAQPVAGESCDARFMRCAWDL